MWQVRRTTNSTQERREAEKTLKRLSMSLINVKAWQIFQGTMWYTQNPFLFLKQISPLPPTVIFLLYISGGNVASASTRVSVLQGHKPCRIRAMIISVNVRLALLVCVGLMVQRQALCMSVLGSSPISSIAEEVANIFSGTSHALKLFFLKWAWVFKGA